MYSWHYSECGNFFGRSSYTKLLKKENIFLKASSKLGSFQKANKETISTYVYIVI